MATKASNFTDADALTGDELIPVIQNGNKKTTLNEIANFIGTDVSVAQEAATRADADSNLQSQINTLSSTKLDAADYNEHFKGKYPTLSALQTANPTANSGDYAQVDTGAGSDVINYNWDVEDGWIEGGSGSAATNTDQLPEGSSNFYFTAARVLATVLTGFSAITGGDIVSTDSVLIAFGKIQKRFNDLLTNFNGANQLVKLDSAAKLPAVDGSQLTNLPSSGGDGGSSVGVASGTNTYTVACTPTVTALSVGLCVRILFTNGNTGASTINVDGTGVVNIYTGPSTALIAGKIAANTIYELYYDGTVWQLGSVQAVPTAANKVITTNASGALQAVNDLIDINSTTTEATLMAANWSTGQANVAGVGGTKVYGIVSGYLYECSGTNTWWRTPLTNWVELYLPDVADGAGVKTSAQMSALYPGAIPGNKVKGAAGFYEYCAGFLGWVYTPYFDNNSSGTATFSGDGSKTTFSVAFAANIALPTVVNAVANSAAAAAPFYINNISISGFDIVFLSAPAAGSNNIVFKYKATR